MAFKDFEIRIRKAFGSLIKPGQENVWIDPYHRTGKRYCAKAKAPDGTPLFISCNPLSGTITVYKGKHDTHPTVICA